MHPKEFDAEGKFIHYRKFAVEDLEQLPSAYCMHRVYFGKLFNWFSSERDVCQKKASVWELNNLFTRTNSIEEEAGGLKR